MTSNCTSCKSLFVIVSICSWNFPLFPLPRDFDSQADCSTRLFGVEDKLFSDLFPESLCEIFSL